MAMFMFLLLAAPMISIAFAFSAECQTRYELADALRGENNCSITASFNSICAKDITVAYTESKPYVFKENGVVKGLLPDILRSIVSTCCLGCNDLVFDGPMSYLDKLEDKKSMIAMPIETSKSSKKFFGRDFLYLLEVPSVIFLLKPHSHSASELTTDLFKSVLSTWPLFITALLMAIIAGIAVWMMDTWFNALEFPRSFLKGPFEGFWWAFVSMTTVGYGDRAPKSYIARIFAVIWIFLGVTIFSMYSAALTSALTKKVVVSSDSLSGKKIAVVNTTAAAHAAARKENAELRGYGSIEKLIEALKKEEVDGAALDDNIANHYSEKIYAELPNYEFRHRVPVQGTAYGIIIKNTGHKPGSLQLFFDSFFMNNEDQREAIIAQAMAGVKKRAKTISKETTSVFSHESPIFIVTLFCLLGIGGCLFVAGLCIQYGIFRRKGLTAKNGGNGKYQKANGRGFEMCKRGKEKKAAKVFDAIEKEFMEEATNLCNRLRKKIENVIERQGNMGEADV
eukprot:gene6226-6942_t